MAVSKRQVIRRKFPREKERKKGERRENWQPVAHIDISSKRQNQGCATLYIATEGHFMCKRHWNVKNHYQWAIVLITKLAKECRNWAVQRTRPLPLGHVHTNTHTACRVHTMQVRSWKTRTQFTPGNSGLQGLCWGVQQSRYSPSMCLSCCFFYCFFLSTTTNINTAAVASWNYLSIVLNENKSRLTFQPWKIKIITTWQQQRLWFPATLRIFFSFSFVLLFLCHADHDKFIAIYLL